VAGPSDIEWTDATWNPVAGCLMVSPGCTNCYAMRMAARLQAMKHPSYRAVTRKSAGRHVWTGHLNLNEHTLLAPLSWQKSRRIFVNSMSDLFQDGIPDDFIAKIWEVMAKADWHIFQVLTKRPRTCSKSFMNDACQLSQMYGWEHPSNVRITNLESTNFERRQHQFDSCHSNH
jgi:protein gp37